MTTPYDYTPAVLYAIDLISEGATKTAACDESNISTGTFDNYLTSNPELQDMYDDSYQRGTDSMADALLEIDNHKRYGQSDPKMAKVMSDNIKWLLSKRRSKDYGDKIEINHNITADKAITQALLAGKQRALESSFDVIDVTPEHVEDDELTFIS